MTDQALRTAASSALATLGDVMRHAEPEGVREAAELEHAALLEALHPLRPGRPTLQAVLGALSDREAIAVWKVLAAAAENERSRDVDSPEESDPDYTLAGEVADRLDAVVAGTAA